MFTTSRLGAVCYYVNDVDRTEAFYRDVLGLQVERMEDDGEGNPWLSARTANGVELIFIKQESRPGNTPIVVFEIAEGGIDDIVSELADKGATIVTPVSHAPGAGPRNSRTLKGTSFPCINQRTSRESADACIGGAARSANLADKGERRVRASPERFCGLDLEIVAAVEPSVIEAGVLCFQAIRRGLGGFCLAAAVQHACDHVAEQDAASHAHGSLRRASEKTSARALRCRRERLRSRSGTSYTRNGP